MESCFPPLAALSLRGSSGSKGQKNRHSTGGVQPAHDDIRLQNHKDFLPKLEVLQDLDLYYIRQIASSLKVRNIEKKCNKNSILFCQQIFFFFFYADDNIVYTIVFF